MHSIDLLFLLAGLLALSVSAVAQDGAELLARLTPEPQQLEIQNGTLALQGEATVVLPFGPDYEACKTILLKTLRDNGMHAHIRTALGDRSIRFVVGNQCETPPLPASTATNEAYTLVVRSDGITAQAASPTGLMYAAETLRQVQTVEGKLPSMTVVDYPAFRYRGLYIEGGQERFGRIVAKDYLCRQIRQLAAFKMNMLIIECYNLFPFASFPACADEGTLSMKDCKEIVEEAKRYHVTIVPSLQTLAQAYELVWLCDAGKPYREPTAPGLMCPSNPAIYPFIKGLYRDLLTMFDNSPFIGIGCSEIEMQWQGRFCPKCQARINAGKTVRDLLLGHADECIKAVHEVATELERPIRPMMWGDEFYMYGPGRDWIGMERIPKDTVMGFWKYWADYAGIAGLTERGYDVMCVSAMYNHCFYLADLSPESPKKSWPSMEQTGTRNIAEMAQEATADNMRGDRSKVLGIATASFSKHRLRAFDSIWYGFALNGHYAWSHPERTLEDRQRKFTRAFVTHYYDCRTKAAAEEVANAWEHLDQCKSQLELANQSLHDVIGVVDTQEAGYVGNSFMGAFERCESMMTPNGQLNESLILIRRNAELVQTNANRVIDAIACKSAQIRNTVELKDLQLAAKKISVHAERQILMIDSQSFLSRAPTLDVPAAKNEASMLTKRWTVQRAKMTEIARMNALLYRRGDPCGDQALLRDMEAIERHFASLLSHHASEQVGDVWLDERFDRIDPLRWIVLGHPQVENGRLLTQVTGGWENRCGIATRDALTLSDAKPLVVEFTVKPIKMGIDSQIFASANEVGVDSYQFCFYGPSNHFGVYTKLAHELKGPWQDSSAGWKLRTKSAEVELGQEYRVHAEIRRRSFRIIVHRLGDTAWNLPFWDSQEVPMDSLDSTRLRFADVEPEGGSAASEWSHIVIRCMKDGG